MIFRKIISALLVLVTLCAYSQKQHPNLILTGKGVEEIRQNLNKLPILSASFNRIKAEVDHAIAAGNIVVPVPKDPGGGFTHEVHRQNGIRMHNAGIVWQVMQEEKYALYLKSIFVKYAALYPTFGVHPEGKNSSSPGVLFWQSLNDAVWLVYVAQAYDCIYNYLSPAERARIENQLLRPAAELFTKTRKATFDRIHNHGTWAVAGVSMTGYAIGDKQLVEKSILGSNMDKKTGFLAQIDNLFSPDGYFLEGPYYQRYSTMPFILCAKAIQNNEPERKIFAYKDSVLKKSVATMLQLTSENGALFPFNDIIKGKTWVTAELVYAVDVAFADFGKKPDYLFVAKAQNDVMLSSEGVAVAKAIQEGKTPASFARKSLSISDGPKGNHGGVGILRSEKGRNSLTLAMKYGEYGMEHGHFDKLNFILYHGDDEVLLDYGSARFMNIEQKEGGRYLAENRTWAKQTIAHNTLTVDEKSNYDANSKIAESSYSVARFFDIVNPDIQVMSAMDTTACPGITMQRTMALISGKEFMHPFIIDLFQATSTKKHQYDFAYNFDGNIVETSVDYKPEQSLYPLGTNNGYQHLWKRACGTPANDGGYMTWYFKNNLYTITHNASPDAEIIFTQLGATDPDFNLRNQQGMIVRYKDTASVCFASIIEAHGNHNYSSEITTQPRSFFISVEIIADTDEGTIMQLKTRSGENYLFMVCSHNTHEKAIHRISSGNSDYHWTGRFSLKKIH